jgi:hypothetical protein
MIVAPPSSAQLARTVMGHLTLIDQVQAIADAARDNPATRHIARQLDAALRVSCPDLPRGAARAARELRAAA